MPIITQPRHFSGTGHLEIVEVSPIGLNLNVRKADGETILGMFVSWTDLSKLLRSAPRARN